MRVGKWGGEGGGGGEPVGGGERSNGGGIGHKWGRETWGTPCKKFQKI